MSVGGIDDEALQKLYTWVDEIKLSRPKRNMARDFSDGVLTAEIVHFYFPKLVQLHNYTAANSVQQKLYNWNTLNRKEKTVEAVELHLQMYCRKSIP